MPESETDQGQFWPVVLGAGLLGAALILGSLKWPQLLSQVPLGEQVPFRGTDPGILPVHPLMEIVKLLVATMIGIVVTVVHKRYHRDKPLPRSLQQAQVLLCLAGALVMVIIGSSVARAFGVAGAAGVVRFRTPVEDPKDTTLLFLLIGLGMACGSGLLEVAGMGAVFLCLVLALLDRFGESKMRSMMLSLVATSKEFPTEAVNRILAQSVEFFEAREVVQANEAIVRYHVTMEPHISVSWLSQQLMAAGLKSVAWGEPGKKDKDK